MCQYIYFCFCFVAKSIFKLAHKYRPETKLQKKVRLREDAQKKSDGQESSAGKKPVVLKYGINHITTLVEQKRAQLVVIAHDVDPVEVSLLLTPQTANGTTCQTIITKWRNRIFYQQILHTSCILLHIPA